MEKTIAFKDNNHLDDDLRRDWSDQEWIDEFYKFLQGEVPESITLKRKLKLTPKQAFTVIWYLQEHLRILPSNIERCSICNSLYDTESEGWYAESQEKFYCSGCDHLAPNESK